MKLLYTSTQKAFKAEIVAVEEKDFQRIKKSRQLEFDWEEERDKDVFKIVPKSEEGNPEILGLISLTNIREELRIHINLVESSNENKGKHKKVDRIAGCLIAFAVKLAFEQGYMGFTSLIPKIELIELYIEKYGFSQYGRQLAIERKAAMALIQKYL